MKSIVCMLSFLVIVTNISAQITVTNATFPSAGDKLKLAENVNISTTLNLGNVAGPQVWDFSVLNSGRTYQEVYQDAKSGKDAASFTDASIVLVQDGQEEYFRNTGTKLEGLGFGGENPIFGAPVVVRYIKRPILRHAPLTFISTTSSEGEFRISIPASVFPDSLLSIFPAGFKPDSIRIEFVSAASSLMDAFGMLKMQGQNFDVLREKASETSQTKISIRIGFLGWVNLESIASSFNIPLPPFIKQFLGVNKTTTYNFYSNTKKEVLVSASYDSLNVLEGVIFADLGGVTSSTKNEYAAEFKIFPNPASNMVNIHSPNLKAGSYLLTLTDIYGKVVHAQLSELNAESTKQIDLSAYNKGLYLLTIRDQFNTFTATSKILVE